MKTILLALALLGAGSGVATAQTAQTAKQPATHSRAFPHADGPFNAMMVLIPEADLEEFKKPPEQGPRLHIVRTVKIKERFAAKIVFMSFALDHNRGDVTYDIRGVRPDGVLMGGKNPMDLKGLKAFQGEATRPDNVFDSGETIIIEFDDGDPPGVYRFEAVLHDNIGNRHIPLKAEVTLIK